MACSALNWQLVETGFNPLREREVESLLAIGNGYLGMRASLEEGNPHADPATLVSGIYELQAEGGSLLVNAPDWSALTLLINGEPLQLTPDNANQHRRILDLRGGLLMREWTVQGLKLTFWRFASMANPNLMCQRLVIEALEPVDLEVHFELRANDPNLLYTRQVLSDGGIYVQTKAQVSQLVVGMGSISRVQATEALSKSVEVGTGAYECWRGKVQPSQTWVMDRFVSIVTNRDALSEPMIKTITRQLRQAQAEGWDNLLMEHRTEWADLWSQTDIAFNHQDNPLQCSVRFALYHLMIAAPQDAKPVSIGARALTGTVYQGHIFWDTEIFILPFYIYTWPSVARQLLMYRYRTLPAARQNAVDKGYRGALYPWESAETGVEETPPYVRLPDGEIIIIYTGMMEDHIVSDVAFGVWHYWQATQDFVFLREAGAEMLLECARFWASRVSTRPDGYHIESVVGPDEYHENIHDNIFTNVMARWNLRIGAEVGRWLQAQAPDVWRYLKTAFRFSDEELNHWDGIAEQLHCDDDEPLIEQFDGFFRLQPVDLTQYQGEPAPLDMILGRHRIQQTQVIKQADVLMLFLLLPDFRPDLAAHFDYYEPKTAHGSSLSPAVHALLAARLGRVQLALKYLQLAVDIDLNNTMGNASGGVHAAAMGGVWQALIFGFAGIQFQEETVKVRPHLPADWQRFSFRLQYRQRTLWFVFQLQAEGWCLDVTLEGDDPLLLEVADQPAQWLRSNQTVSVQLFMEKAPDEPARARG